MSTSLSPEPDAGSAALVSAAPPRRRRRLKLFAGLVLLLAFVWFGPSLVNLARFHRRIESAMSAAVGRPVKLYRLHLKLLPVPGFVAGDDESTGIIVEDDPAFSAEPVLRANEVVANLRLTSLWRGRLEVASLSLKGASFNLVRNAEGEWNVERLVVRASEVPTAPTAKKQAEARARFPYLEATDARINLKLGNEKTPFVLSQTEFALWLAAEDRWNLRLEGVPLRTDRNMSDTGVLKLSGSFDRAPSLEETPFHFKLNYEKAQLGQLTALLYGRDRGWRGAVVARAEVTGTPAEFTGTSSVEVNEFRRYDISRPDGFDVRLNCDWNSSQMLDLSAPGGDVAQELYSNCTIPLGQGQVAVRTILPQVAVTRPSYMRIQVQQVPAAAVARALAHMKATLPEDLFATGTADGEVVYDEAQWSGVVKLSGCAVRTREIEPELPLPTLSLQAANGSSAAEENSFVPSLRLASATISLDAAHQLQIAGDADAQNYRLSANGSAPLARLLQLSRLLGLRPPAGAVNGEVTLLHSTLSGEWRGFSPAQFNATAQLQRASLPLRGFNERVSVASANVNIAPAQLSLTNIRASFPEADVTLTGDVAANRKCPTSTICELQFHLSADSISVAALRELILPKQRSGPLAIFSSPKQIDLGWLLANRATGTISARRFALGRAVATNVSAQLEFLPGVLHATGMHGQIFGGRYDSKWSADFTGDKPKYEGSGVLDQAAAEQIGAALGDSFGSGALHLSHEIAFSGLDSGELRSSAVGSATFLWTKGTLDTPQIPPLRFASWKGGVTVQQGQITFDDNEMLSAGKVAAMIGAVSLDHVANLELRSGTNVQEIKGSLRVEPAPATRASK